MSEEINEMVGDLISQLQQSNTEVRSRSRAREPLTKENLEDFVIQKSSLLVDGTIDMVETVKDYITSAPESKDVASLAELINAATNAVETLNKIVLSNKKNNTIMKIKEMDIESKRELQQAESDTKIQLTREEMFKMLINNKPIEAEIVETKQLTD